MSTRAVNKYSFANTRSSASINSGALASIHRSIPWPLGSIIELSGCQDTFGTISLLRMWRAMQVAFAQLLEHYLSHCQMGIGAIRSQLWSL